MARSLFVGRLFSALELVDLSLQAFQLNAFRLQPLGFPLLGLSLLCLQTVRLDAFLATALALQPLRLLGGGSSGGFESFFFCSLGAFGSQSSSLSLLGLACLASRCPPQPGPGPSAVTLLARTGTFGLASSVFRCCSA